MNVTQYTGSFPILAQSDRLVHVTRSSLSSVQDPWNRKSIGKLLHSLSEGINLLTRLFVF